VLPLAGLAVLMGALACLTLFKPDLISSVLRAVLS